MWKWDKQLTLEMNINKALVENLRKYAKISGILLIILGAVGIVFPTFMSFTTLTFVSYLMLFAGLSSAWFTWSSNKKDWAGWLKSLMLVLVGSLILFYPMQGIASLGLVFAIYFFTDAFAGFGLAFSMRPDSHWLLWLLNAVTSLALAVIFIIGWPFSSLYMVGLLVGISLFFDGIALLSGGFVIDKALKESDETKT